MAAARAVRSLAVLAVLLVVAVAAVGAYVVVTREEPPPPVAPERTLLWSIPADDLATIGIALPRRELAETWVVGPDRRWRFDRPDGPRVDPKRWGDGIVLLLDNPVAERTIAQAAGPEDLAAFGLVRPSMIVDLTTVDGTGVRAFVGDATPDGGARYVAVGGVTVVHTIDATWYAVMERLVADPPVLDAR